MKTRTLKKGKCRCAISRSKVAAGCKVGMGTSLLKWDGTCVPGRLQLSCPCLANTDLQPLPYLEQDGICLPGSSHLAKVLPVVARQLMREVRFTFLPNEGWSTWNLSSLSPEPTSKKAPFVACQPMRKCSQFFLTSGLLMWQAITSSSLCSIASVVAQLIVQK